MSQARRPSAKRRRLLTAALSVAGHALVLFLVLSARPPVGPPPEDPPISVQLAQLPPPPLPETPKPTPTPEPEPPAKPPPPRHVARPVKAPPPPQIVPLPAGKGPTGDSAEVSEGLLSTAATAGSGGGGRACDMTQRLQAALRKDPQVRAAVAEAHHGRALMVWNGDWVRHEGQEGAGLAAVREAIMWEVGFAPAACRTEPMRGLVAISMNDGPPASRLVIGSGAWRWSDMLKARGGISQR
jgi:type IV secretory pathway VirB10-like protein